MGCQGRHDSSKPTAVALQYDRQVEVKEMIARETFRKAFI